MKIRDLKTYLDVLPEEFEVYVQTVPNDWCSPLQLQNLSVTLAKVSDKDGFQQSTLVLTAHFPSGGDR